MQRLLILFVYLTLSGTSVSAASDHHLPSVKLVFSRQHQSSRYAKKVRKETHTKARVLKNRTKGRVMRRKSSAPARQVVRSAKASRFTVSGRKRINPVYRKVSRPISRNLAIMGRTYATIPILDGLLSGTVYYLASGHGGPDPGAIGRYGTQRLPEDEYAYDVTIRLARVLIQHGATVYMIVQDRNDGIRDSAVLPIDYDEIAYPNQSIPRNQTSRLRQTTTVVNGQFARHKGHYQRFITIHVDSRSKGQTIDVFFYHHPQSRAGLTLARHIHRKFQANYKRYQPARPYLGRVSSRGSLYVIKNSHPPTVFIELGNIQNQQDQRRFVLAGNRQALANWLYQGMLADYQTR